MGYMGQVMEVWLSCYLAFLLVDSKTRYQDNHTFMLWKKCELLNVSNEKKLF